MQDIDALVAEFEAYCSQAGIAPSTLGALAVKDSRFFKRLRAGNVTLTTIEKVRGWIVEHPARASGAAESAKDAAA